MIRHCRTCTCTLGRLYEVRVPGDGSVVIGIGSRPGKVTRFTSFGEDDGTATWRHGIKGEWELVRRDGQLVTVAREERA